MNSVAVNPNERRFFAVSIKHSQCPAGSKRYLLWGCMGKTPDDAHRCFSGYTYDPDVAEVYSLAEFTVKYKDPNIVPQDPVKITFDMPKRYRKYDTVLVDADLYRQYLQFV